MPLNVAGWATQGHRDQLDKMIVELDVRTVVEIGTFVGASAAWFALHDQIETVTCVDPFEDHTEWSKDLERCGIPNPYFSVFLANMQELNVLHKIRVMKMFSVEAAPRLGQTDLVFIDGDHSYEGCRSDIGLYLPKAQKAICGDDYHSNERGTPHFPGVVRAVNELLPHHSHVGGFWWQLT